MTVAERIKAARKSLGITQKTLGERLGVTQATIQQYESGKRKPKTETLIRIAKALNIQLRELDPRFFGDKMPDMVIDKDGVKYYSGAITNVIDITEIDPLYVYDDTWIERLGKTVEALPEERKQFVLDVIINQRDKWQAEKDKKKDGGT